MEYGNAFAIVVETVEVEARIDAPVAAGVDEEDDPPAGVVEEEVEVSPITPSDAEVTAFSKFTMEGTDVATDMEVDAVPLGVPTVEPASVEVLSGGKDGGAT